MQPSGLSQLCHINAFDNSYRRINSASVASSLSLLCNNSHMLLQTYFQINQNSPYVIANVFLQQWRFLMYLSILLHVLGVAYLLVCITTVDLCFLCIYRAFNVVTVLV